MTAMPVLIAILCLMAIAYRYYSAFLAAKVATLDPDRQTPAYQFNDGQNYHPTNKWVLFGHHFAAISGAGPLIGPVLAAQFGYLPGLLWIVIGVCLGGAVQDFLTLAASMRRGGKSLARIAYSDIGKTAGTAATIAILFIVIIALAGLGKVVVKALGGESVSYAKSTLIISQPTEPQRDAAGIYTVPPGSQLIVEASRSPIVLNEGFQLMTPSPITSWNTTNAAQGYSAVLPPGSIRLVPGSSWGTFTIACTIPIALFIGLYMYKIRPGRVVEASIIGALLTIAATIIGGFVPGSPIEQWFNLKDTTVVWVMAAYGFVASVLPVWVLLCPRDYLSSFLKIGTIILLVGGTIIANPKFEAPMVNGIFLSGGPAVAGRIFPFLFITIMCGAISGFHSLVSSGTTPKMIKNEADARTIGYGAMLIEGLVGVVAMIAASTLPVGDYYAMNTDLGKVPAFHDRILQIPGGGIEHIGEYESLTQESLRGRTGGAVTLAVGMAHIFDGAAKRFIPAADATMQKLWKYWYHFAIMFEALFILTTIDTGTRIGRFLLQEVFGKIHAPLGRADWWPGAIISTLLVVLAWAWAINANSMAGIWPMFGVANQMLAVIALAIVSTYLTNAGRVKYLWVTVIPMCFVATTTSTAAVQLFLAQIDGIVTQLNNAPDVRNRLTLINSFVTAGAIAVIMISGYIVIIAAAIRIWTRTGGLKNEVRGFEPVMGK